MIRRCTVFFAVLLFTFSPLFGDNVGLLVMATGKYIRFVDPLIASADRYFCKDHTVTYFVFTDSDLPSTEKVVYIPQKRLGWPFDTMMRYHAYAAHKDILSSQDYLFACDADMLFVGDVGNEILGKRVATIHPGFVGRRGTYETNSISTAYVPFNEGEYYFAGGFYGGETEEFFHILDTTIANITQDLNKNYIAIWHDESHWNRYCIDFKPTVILSPSYCYPEGWNIPFTPKLMPLNKNHTEMRTP